MDRLFVLLCCGLLATWWATSLLQPGTNGPERSVVTKVIDGDTVIVDDGSTIRLAGIDTDETDYPCYTPAKQFLEEHVLGKEVVLEKAESNRGTYDRKLRYLILNGSNINIDLVRKGLAITRTNGEAVYQDQLLQAQEHAAKNDIGCKWSGGGWTSEEGEQPPARDENHEATGIAACNARKAVNSTTTITGTVVDVYRSETATYLNLERSYPDQCFTVVIWADQRAVFKDVLDGITGTTIAVTGQVSMYDGVPEMAVRNPGAIKAVDG